MTEHRLYDYTTGRFLNVDPKADAVRQESWTPYHYGLNNPVLNNDPTGEFVPFIVAGVALVGYLLAPKPLNAPGRDRRANRRAQKNFDNAVVGSTVTAIAVGEAISSYGFDDGDPEPEYNPDTESFDNGENNPYKDRSDKELEKSKNSYEKLIDEHNNKLDEFKKDPEGQSDPKKLEEVKKKSPESVEKFYKGREKALEKQIRKQKGELDKINKEIERRGTNGTN